MSGSVRDGSGPWTHEGGGQELGQETRKLDRNPDINIHYFRPTDLLNTPSDAQSRKESASIDQRGRNSHQKRVMSEILPTKPAPKKIFVFIFFVGSENCSGGEKNYFKSSRTLKKIKFICKKSKNTEIIFYIIFDFFVKFCIKMY